MWYIFIFFLSSGHLLRSSKAFFFKCSECLCYRHWRHRLYAVIVLSLSSIPYASFFRVSFRPTYRFLRLWRGFFSARSSRSNTVIEFADFRSPRPNQRVLCAFTLSSIFAFPYLPDLLVISATRTPAHRHQFVIVSRLYSRRSLLENISVFNRVKRVKQPLQFHRGNLINRYLNFGRAPIIIIRDQRVTKVNELPA